MTSKSKPKSETAILFDSILLLIVQRHLGVDHVDPKLRRALRAAFIAGAALGNQIGKLIP